MKRAAAWILLGLDLAGLICLVAVAATKPSLMGSPLSLAALGLMAASFAAVGGLLALRRPGNAEGWLLLAVGTAWVLPLTSTAIGQALLSRHPGGAAAAWLAWPGVWLWLPPLGLMGTQILLRFPDGALPTRRWRWFSRLSLGLIVLATAAMATVAPTDADGYPNLTYLPWVPQGLIAGAGLAALACFPVSVASVVVRYRRARITEREQIRWVAWAAGVFVGVYLLSIIPGQTEAFSDSDVMTAVVFAAYALVPVAIGFAILRYRLYDIDRLVSRTLSYTAITAVLAGVYVGCVALLTNVLPFSGEAGTAASVLVAVALFAPLRRRVQRVVDRRFNRPRYDAEAIVAAFARRMREQVDLETVRGDLAAVVTQTIGPAHSSLWLRPEP
ncbi:MAG: hypothetical protein ACRDOH_25045 [Streptosporangiaceae bacterium]